MKFTEEHPIKLWWLYVLLGIETIIVCGIMFRQDNIGAIESDVRER